MNTSVATRAPTAPAVMPSHSKNTENTEVKTIPRSVPTGIIHAPAWNHGVIAVFTAVNMPLNDIAASADDKAPSSPRVTFCGVVIGASVSSPS